FFLSQLHTHSAVLGWERLKLLQSEDGRQVAPHLWFVFNHQNLFLTCIFVRTFRRIPCTPYIRTSLRYTPHVSGPQYSGKHRHANGHHGSFTKLTLDVDFTAM